MSPSVRSGWVPAEAEPRLSRDRLSQPVLTVNPQTWSLCVFVAVIQTQISSPSCSSCRVTSPGTWGGKTWTWTTWEQPDDQVRVYSHLVYVRCRTVTDFIHHSHGAQTTTQIFITHVCFQVLKFSVVLRLQQETTTNPLITTTNTVCVCVCVSVFDSVPATDLCPCCVAAFCDLKFDFIKRPLTVFCPCCWQTTSISAHI